MNTKNDEHCHTHEHHSHEHDQGPEIKLQHHEDALIISTTQSAGININDFCQKLELFLNEISEYIESEGGLVGHLKGFIHETNHGISFSCTGAETTFKTYDLEKVDFSIVLIVYNIPEDNLMNKLKDFVLSL